MNLQDPGGFSARLTEVRGLVDSDAPAAAEGLRRLIRDGIRSEQVLPLAEVIGKLPSGMPGYATARISVLGEPTTNAVAAAVAVAAMGEGLISDVRVSSHGSVRQEILDGSSELYAFQPNVALIVPNPVLQPSAVDAESARMFSVQHVDEWLGLWSVLGERVPGVRVLHHLYEQPDHLPAGLGEQRLSWSASSITRAVNEQLVAGAPASVHLIDMDGLAAEVGRANWRDQRLWLHGKLPFSPRHLATYTTALASALRRATGRVKKALIVDLDNTLWGGVIGDDGINGIKLGPGEPIGESYAQLAAYVQQLGRRGVILGVCSKNEHSTAAEVFKDHPHMPLNLEDFSAFLCNWQDKASNLREMIAKLNIDPSAVVFADDNPFECGLVRKELPAVEVVELAGDPANFVGKLDRLRYFEVDGFSAEDLGRAASYRAREAADGTRTSAASLEEYLIGLRMRGSFRVASQSDLPRLAQMEGKTNQFNVTTRRYSADQLASFVSTEGARLHCFSLVDRFADHGLVGSMVVSYGGGEARIHSWLLSCRVFSRGCEEFMMNRLCFDALAHGARVLIGEYRPTEKNKVVADLYTRLGFTPTGDSTFEYDLGTHVAKTCYIEAVDNIQDPGAAAPL